MSDTGFRCEEFFGEGYRDAASVMAHETFVLDNTNILDYLIQSDIISNSTKEYLRVYTTLMEEGRLIHTGYDTDYEEMLYRFREKEQDRIEFFQEVLSDIKETTGIIIHFCLWLCDAPEDSFDSYNLDFQKKISDFSFDEYEKSTVVLADIGKEGKLYGYEYEPKPIRSVQVPVNND